MAHSLSSALSVMFGEGLDSLQATFKVFHGAGTALRKLLESPCLNPDHEFKTESGTTSLRALVKERDRLETAEIVEENSVVTDEVCKLRITEFMDFALKFMVATEIFEHDQNAPVGFEKEGMKLFHGADNLRQIANAYETGRQTGLREAKSRKPREPVQPKRLTCEHRGRG